MYRKLIKPILFAMNIERAHSTVLFLLRMIGKIPGGRALLRAMYRTEHPSLEREVFGLRFPNPIGLAAGFDRNGEAFRELSALGFGFVEIGTVTPQPQAGNPRPRIFRLPADRAIINRSGLNNKGLYKAIAQLRHRHDRLIIGGNIGKNNARHNLRRSRPTTSKCSATSTNTSIIFRSTSAATTVRTAAYRTTKPT